MRLTKENTGASNIEVIMWMWVLLLITGVLIIAFRATSGKTIDDISLEEYTAPKTGTVIEKTIIGDSDSRAHLLAVRLEDGIVVEFDDMEAYYNSTIGDKAEVNLIQLFESETREIEEEYYELDKVIVSEEQP